MGYLNEDLRVANQANNYDVLEIHCNGNFFLGGDNTSVAVIWNNIIGANMDDVTKHRDYLSFMKSQGLRSGTISIVGDGKKVVEAVELLMYAETGNKMLTFEFKTKMNQEIHATLKVSRPGVAEMEIEQLQKELEAKLKNKNTTIEVSFIDTQHYHLKIIGEINAAWTLKMNHKTAEYINDYMLQGLELEMWQIRVIAIKQESEIYKTE